MSRKPVLLIWLLLTFGVLAAACSSSDTTTSEETTVAESTTSTAAKVETATTTATVEAVDPSGISSFEQAFEAMATVADTPDATADFPTYFEGLNDEDQAALLDKTFGFTSAEERETFFIQLLGVDEDELATFTVEGTEAVMAGVINSSTPEDVRELIRDHPEVTTIVMVDVPGSIDDEANLEASLLVREAGLNTHLNADGAVASGGVDFYLAGVERTFEPGASFGVHSWADGAGTEGKDVPRDDPQHLLYLDYYDQVGIAKEFYWFTLEAAPADGIYIMTPEDLATYGFSTN